MKKILIALALIGVYHNVAYAAQCCRVNDTFTGNCPTAKDLGWGSAAPDPLCVCTAGKPAICKITDIFNECPNGTTAGQYIKNCVCTECTTGGTHPGGSTGCTTLSCTACADTDWVSNGAGYEVKKTGGTCVGNSCTSHGTCSGQTIEYRCADGYCGTTTDGKTGCTKITSDLQKYCRITETFIGACPSGTQTQNCICTNTNPKRCQDAGIYDSLPSWATQYNYTCLNYLSIGTGYEKSTQMKIDTNGCTLSDGGYRCATGYYGQPTSATSGCTKCPEPGTSIPATQTIANCYVPADQTFSDSVGNYQYTSNCYYN